MQITVKERETLTGGVSIASVPFDVHEMPLSTINLTVHAISGTGLTFEIQFQTSDNLLDWKTIGSTIPQTTAGTALGVLSVPSHNYGRFLRAMITLAGTEPSVNYSIWVNTFSSS